MNEPRPRRKNSYWEPIYNSTDNQPFPNKTIDVHQTGCKHSTIDANSFGAKFRRLDREMFDTCDFAGIFKGKVFNDCNFSLCDFGLSTWKYSKFSRCSFVRSSFTQTNLIGCEFRDCSWSEIGLSGNGTNLLSTTISNPKAFIDAAFTNLDIDTLNRAGKSVYYQKLRLQRTKANVARSLLNILATKGEEEWYYQAVRTYSINSFRASQMENAWQIKQAVSFKSKFKFGFSVADYFLERWIAEFIGSVNRWGASLSRPIFIGGSFAVIFSMMYRFLDVFDSWGDAVTAAVEITLVAGFAKYDALDKCPHEHFLFLINMLFGVFWFAILVPSLVSRASRVRG